MTELAILGNIAYAQRGKTLYYDGKAHKFTNSDEANKRLSRTYREGFKLSV